VSEPPVITPELALELVARMRRIARAAEEWARVTADPAAPRSAVLEAERRLRDEVGT
jgi:hypothetical protein